MNSDESPQETAAQWHLVERNYRVDELARKLSFSRDTIYRWIRQGDIKAIKVRGVYRIPYQEVLRCIRPNEVSGPTFVPGQKGIYLLKSHRSGLTKIGKAGNLRQRMLIYWAQVPEDLELVAFWPVPTYDTAEKLLHNDYRDKRVKGEWFDLSAKHLKELIDDRGFRRIGLKLSKYLGKLRP